MIQKYLIKLYCTQGGEIKGHAGVELHGLFFKLLELNNKMHANFVHNMQQKPFSIGPLTGSIQRFNGKALVKEEESYYFTIASLDDELTETISKILEKINDKTITIGKASFILKQFKTLLPNETSFFTLLASSQSLANINLEFMSPTCFRRKNQWFIFPDAELLFNSLLEKWNTFADAPLPAIDTSCIRVVKYNLKTTMSQLGKYNIIGFMGKCDFSFAPETSETTKRVVNVLCQFAQIMGVGYKTTMGMGQVKINKNNKFH